MNRPIVLWDPPQTTTIDDAGIVIVNVPFPPPPPDGPYEHPRLFNYVPPLTYLCLQRLVPFPDQIPLDGFNLQYRPSDSPSMFDLLLALVPDYKPFTLQQRQLALVDPRLWAVLIQLYRGIPEALRTYRIPLSDKHVPLLQHIPHTSCFSLVTVLELPRCRNMTDRTVGELKYLNQLAALDISSTEVSTDAIRILSRTRVWGLGPDGTRVKRGPWDLRILSLRRCTRIDENVYKYLDEFTLLSVVDLRGSGCKPRDSSPIDLEPAADEFLDLYHPTPITVCLTKLALRHTKATVHSSSNVYTLHIDSLWHERRDSRRRDSDVVGEDTYVVLPGQAKDSEPSRMKVGSTTVLTRRIDQDEEEERYERNKEAWYKRNARKSRHCWSPRDLLDEEGYDPDGPIRCIWGAEGSYGDDEFDSENTDDSLNDSDDDDDDQDNDDEAHDDNGSNSDDNDRGARKEAHNADEGDADPSSYEKDVDESSDVVSDITADPDVHTTLDSSFHSAPVASSLKPSIRTLDSGAQAFRASLGESVVAKSRACPNLGEARSSRPKDETFDPRKPPSNNVVPMPSSSSVATSSNDTLSADLVAGPSCTLSRQSNSALDESVFSAEHLDDLPRSISSLIKTNHPSISQPASSSESTSSYRWQNVTAREVHTADVSRRTTAAFYQKQDNCLHPSPQFAPQERMLMLYRPPPPRSNVDATAEAVAADTRQWKRRRGADDVLADVDRSKAKYKAFMQNIDTWSSRWKLSAVPASTASNDTLPAPNPTRNIFRRAERPEKALTTTAAHTSEARQNEPRSAVRDLAKPIRPVSSLPQPPWPKRQVKASQEAASGGDKQRRETRTSQVARPPTKAKSSGPLDAFFNSDLIKNSQEGAKESHIRPSLEREGSQNKPSQFNWKEWGRK